MKNKKSSRWLKLLPYFFVIIIFSYSCQKENSPLPKPDKQTSMDVSVDLASKIALNFTKNESFTDSCRKGVSLKSGNLSPFSMLKEKEIEKIITINGEDNSPAIYIIKFKPNGFIILSASKKERAILGFSESNILNENFGDIGLSDWILSRKKRIEDLKHDATYKIPKSVKEEWLYIAPVDGDEIIVSGGTVNEQYGPLLQTTWGQDSPYNINLTSIGCLNDEHGKPPTGCVATAIAQIVRKWQFPSSYNWSIMPNFANRYSYITSGTIELARLMKNAGAGAKTSYVCGGSGATVTNARNAFVNTFGYSSSASIINYNESAADTYIVPNIQAGQPVLMGGIDLTYGGHAWVCDGYKRYVSTLIHNPGTHYEYETTSISNFYLSLNWGWNGDSNGYFLTTDFTPGNFNFSSGQQCIINIHP